MSQAAVTEIPLQGRGGGNITVHVVHILNFYIGKDDLDCSIERYAHGLSAKTQRKGAPLVVLEVKRCVEREEVARKRSVCEER